MTTDQLKKAFNKAMVQIFVRAEKEAKYRATIFHQMLTDYGGLMTAKKLVAPMSKVSDGYTALWERKRLDLTVEALIVRRPWIDLFNAEEIATAKKRLKEYGADLNLIEPDFISPTVAPRLKWSKEALELCVSRYFEMLSAIERDEKLDKTAIFRELSESTGGHSDGSVRNLFQNISHELTQRGLKTIPGVSSLPNSTDDLRSVLAAHLNELLTAKTIDEVPIKEARARHLVQIERVPIGNANPQKMHSSDRFYFVRDLQVSIYVKAIASGQCELCEQAAPFQGRDGIPYLEVHHVKTLADGGPDFPSNTVALCPNCHRAIHLSNNVEKMREALYAKIRRLVRV